MDTNGAVILCVEDEAEIRRDLVDELLDAGYEVHEAGSGSEAIGRLAGLQPDLILCDVNMPGLSGLVIANRLVHRNYISSSAADGKYGVTAGALDAGAATKKLVIEGGVARLY